MNSVFMTPTPLPQFRRLRCAIGAAALALAATGCHVSNPYKPTDPTQASQAASTLTSLPSLEDTKTQMIATMEQVGQRISTAVPTTKFTWRHDESRVGCRPPFEQSDGQVILLPSYVSDVPIPEPNWKQAYDIIAAAAKILGAESVLVFKDAPGDHDVQFSNDTGTVLRLASQKAAVVSGHTGCRLPASKR
jgi:hypothetical protein